MRPMGAPLTALIPAPHGAWEVLCQGWEFEQPGLEMLFLDWEAACVCGLYETLS